MMILRPSAFPQGGRPKERAAPQEIADRFVTLCRAGKFDEAGETYRAEDAASIEAAKEAPVYRGKKALRQKGEAWEAAPTIHHFEVGGPYVNGDQFIVRFTLDLTAKETGTRMKMDETGLYTLKQGMIVEERFFYASA